VGLVAYLMSAQRLLETGRALHQVVVEHLLAHVTDDRRSTNQDAATNTRDT